LDLQNLIGEVASTGSDNKFTIFKIAKGKKKEEGRGVYQKITSTH